MPSPKTMMERVAWSFAEPPPASVDELIRRLNAYAKNIGAEVDARELNRPFPGDRLDIRYSYGVQQPSGNWDDIEVVVRIHSKGATLTFGEILLQLHMAAYEHLKDDDHHFFEGLYLLSRPFEPNVPAYEVYLGS